MLQYKKQKRRDVIKIELIPYANVALPDEIVGQTHCKALAIQGEIDSYSGPDFKQFLLQAAHRIPENGCLFVSLEAGEYADENNKPFLSQGVCYMDSNGLGALVSAGKVIFPKGGQIYVITANRTVRKVMEITKLDEIFHVRKTIGEAKNDILRREDHNTGRQ